MSAITISPTPEQYALLRGEFDAVERALRDQDVDAVVAPRTGKRGPFADFIVYVGEEVAEGVVDVVIFETLRRLRHRGRRGDAAEEDRAPRRFILIGPDGEVLREVDLAEADDAAG